MVETSDTPTQPSADVAVRAGNLAAEYTNAPDAKREIGANWATSRTLIAVMEAEA